MGDAVQASALEAKCFLIAPYLWAPTTPDGPKIRGDSLVEQEAYWAWIESIKHLAVLSNVSKFTWWPGRQSAVAERERIREVWWDIEGWQRMEIMAADGCFPPDRAASDYRGD